MRRSEPDPHWIDTPEGIWTTLSVVMIVVSAIWIPTFYFSLNSTASLMHPLVVAVLYAYFPVVSVVCLLQLGRAKRSEE